MSGNLTSIHQKMNDFQIEIIDYLSRNDLKNKDHWILLTDLILDEIQESLDFNPFSEEDEVIFEQLNKTEESKGIKKPILRIV